MGNIEENADEYKRKHGELPHNHTHAHTDDHSHSHSHTHSKEHSHSSVKEIDEATHEKMHEEGYTHVQRHSEIGFIQRSWRGQHTYEAVWNI